MEASKKRELTCADCDYSREGLDLETLFCEVDGSDAMRRTYKTHSCLLLEVKGIRASEPTGPLS